MTSIVLYFHVHQPFRLRRYTFFDIAREPEYFDDEANGAIIRRVAERCYLPMNALLMRLAQEHGDRFRCAMSITSTCLDQMEQWAPEAFESFLEQLGQSCMRRRVDYVTWRTDLAFEKMFLELLSRGSALSQG